MSYANHVSGSPNPFDVVQEGVRSAREALAGGPRSAFEQFCVDAPVLRSLPEEDRPGFMEAVSDVLTFISDDLPEEERKAAVRAAQELLVPWIWTAEEWAMSPTVRRLSTVLVGDGPAIDQLPPTASRSPGAHSRLGQWLVHAVDDDAFEAWKAVASKLPDPAGRIRAGLASKPQSTPGTKPLRGQLGHVTIGNQVLDHWQVRSPGWSRRGKSTKKDKRTTVGVKRGNAWVAVTFEARVTYAVDETHGTVWITGAHLVRNDPPSRERISIPSPTEA